MFNFFIAMNLKLNKQQGQEYDILTEIPWLTRFGSFLDGSSSTHYPLFVQDLAPGLDSPLFPFLLFNESEKVYVKNPNHNGENVSILASSALGNIF